MVYIYWSMTSWFSWYCKCLDKFGSYGCEPKNSGFSPPQIIHEKIGFSMIFTIHFGGFPRISWKHPFFGIQWEWYIFTYYMISWFLWKNVQRSKTSRTYSHTIHLRKQFTLHLVDFYGFSCTVGIYTYTISPNGSYGILFWMGKSREASKHNVPQKNHGNELQVGDLFWGRLVSWRTTWPACGKGDLQRKGWGG